jgi:hypothetical protein
MATTERTDQLLNVWVRLLSQAEHTQRLLQDEQWEGATSVSNTICIYLFIYINRYGYAI